MNQNELINKFRWIENLFISQHIRLFAALLVIFIVTIYYFYIEYIRYTLPATVLLIAGIYFLI